MSKLLVCGGRYYSDRSRLYQVLDDYAERCGVSLIIHGAARGADALAGEWAADRGITEKRFPADWRKHGRSAGHIRNQEMLDKAGPSVVIAFPGGPGTANMVARARAAGVTIYRIDW